MGWLVVAVGVANLVGCAAPAVEEERRGTGSGWRLGPVIRGPGSLPKQQLRAPGQLGVKGDPCDVARGEARGDGCSGNPGDSYVPAAQCDSGSDSTCPSSNVRPGHFINNTTDPKPYEDQSDPNKLYAENGTERQPDTGEQRTAAATDEDRSSGNTDVAERQPAADENFDNGGTFDTAGQFGDACPDCA